MSNYHGLNHTYLPVIPQPPGVTKYRLANPSYSTQMTPPYGQPNPPPSNHLAFNYEARHGNNRSKEPRDKILYTVFNLCGQSRCFKLESSERRPRRKYTIERSLCNDYDNCNHCSMAKLQSETLWLAIDRELFREFLNTQLSELWTGKGRLFQEGFADSDNKPPPVDPRRIMYVISEARSKYLENKTKEKHQNKKRHRQQKEQQRQQKITASVASELPLQNSSSQMARTNSFSPDNEQDRSSLMVRSFSEPWSWASGGPERR